MSLNLSILFTVEFFSRLTYFGSRAILFLFLVNYLEWPKATVVESYGYFTAIVLLAPFIGGILADFFRNPVLCAIAGTLMVTTGLLILAYFPYHKLVDNGVFFLALGAGFQKPGLLLTFYRQTLNRLRVADALFTIFYLCVTFGSLAGPVIADLVSSDAPVAALHVGIKAMFMCSLVAPTLLLVTYKRLKISVLNESDQSVSSGETQRPMLVFSMVAAFLFWLVYTLVGQLIEASENAALADYSILILLGILLVMVAINIIRGNGLHYKIMGAMVLVALAASAMAFEISGVGLTLVLMTLAETLFGPLILRLVLNNSPGRYAGTLLGVFLSVTYIVNISAGGISSLDKELQQQVFWLLIAGVLAVVAILWSLHNAQKKERLVPEQMVEDKRN